MPNNREPNQPKDPARASRVNYEKRYQRLRRILKKSIKEHSRCRDNMLELLANLKSGVFIVDLTGKIIFMNATATRITGFEKREFEGTHFRGLFSLDDMSEGFRLFYQAIQGNYPDNCLLRIRRKDGNSAIVQFQAAPFYFESRLHGVIAMMADMTERKKLEEANQKRVETFIRFSTELDEWQAKVNFLKQEVNDLLKTLGKNTKYALPES